MLLITALSRAQRGNKAHSGVLKYTFLVLIFFYLLSHLFLVEPIEISLKRMTTPEFMFYKVPMPHV